MTKYLLTLVITKETDFERWCEEMRDLIEEKILLLAKDKKKIAALLEDLVEVCDKH